MTKTYITYFDDKQIDEFNLVANDNIVLFKGNDTTMNGCNINHLNKYYCELCTLYYVWKNNLKSEFVKFQQYRRPFITFGRNMPNKGCAYVFQPLMMNLNEGLRKNFWLYHRENVKRYDMMLDYVQHNHLYSEYYDYLMNGQIMVTNNTFLIGWDDFYNMCTFVFDVLFGLANMLKLKIIDDYEREAYRYDGTIEGFNVDRQEYNSHFMAYIGERLVSCWLLENMFLKFIPFKSKRFMKEYNQ